MLSGLNRLAPGLLTLLLSSSVAGGPPIRHIYGTVRDGNDQGVARTEVRIDGDGVDVTTYSGGFGDHISLVPPLRVGFPVTFRVAGWVITDPCLLARGRMYLPDPDAESIFLKVLRPRDQRLLSGRSIGCLLEQEASHFEAKASPTRSPRSSLQEGRTPVFRGQGAPSIPALAAGSPTDLTIVAVAYRVDGFQQQVDSPPPGEPR